MKPLLISAALGALVALTGCATTAEPVTEYIRLECTVPVAPNFMPPDWQSLEVPFHHIPPDHPDYERYDRALLQLEDYEAQLVDYALELRSGYQTICETDFPDLDQLGL